MTASRHTPARPVTDLATAEHTLREHGLRLSAARRIVLEALFAADGPASAEDLAGGLDGRTMRSDLASVYRNLETLERVGIVDHVHLGHGPGLYTLATGGEREYLTCEACGDSHAVESAALDPAREAIRVATGHVARFSHFPIVGLCAACAETTGPPKGHQHVRPR